ncbi:Exopolyphosphatase [Sandaracinus amylolyticus]|uniref:Exopolyphosphatase n=2 Tax=Sandaracinus amylolyticus TaxID=927083 RepID=A0A0F6SE12_9BACT|nr:Exopolyphosphatase [Sandaracinus amylolyticus]
MHPPAARERRLVVDVGGGSTELVTGTGWTTREAHSTPMGCIRFTERFFPGARISRKRYERARDAAMLELRPFAARLRAPGIDRVLGSSGTMRAIGDIVEARGDAARGTITRRGVDALIEKVCDADTLADIDVEGLADERRPVLPGGLAIVDAVMRTFDLGSIDVADGALREGLLMELVGRLESDDVRDDTIAAFRARHGIDAAHARRVRATAEALFDAVASDWDLGDVELRRWLGWAAELHELGLSVSRSGVARHGAYLVANADAPGFSRDELEAVATLVRTHRGRLDRDMFEPTRRGSRRALKRLAVLLRIAVALHADRAAVTAIPSARAARRAVELTVPREWIASRSLVAADLAAHAAQIQRIGLELEIRTAEG